jgi:hypothetical protein
VREPKMTNRDTKKLDVKLHNFIYEQNRLNHVFDHNIKVMRSILLQEFGIKNRDVIVSAVK